MVGYLFEGLDARAAQWLLARAIRAVSPGRLVSIEAAVLGEQAALQRAFDHGLVASLPDEPGGAIDLRRPLDLLGALEEAPLRLTQKDLLAVLSSALTPEVRLILERAWITQAKPLGLIGPEPRLLVGREDVVNHLVELLAPQDDVTVTVLSGLDGLGKTSVAATASRLLETRLEPVWISFAEGPEKGWTPVASVFDIDPHRPGLEVRDRDGVPRWVRVAQDRLLRRRCLIVIDDADTVPEEQIPAWIPAGHGHCVVLVLSRRPEHALQRQRDAITVRLGALRAEAARELLAERAPHLREAIARGEAEPLLERLGGHPEAITLVAAWLEHTSLEEAAAQIGKSEETVPAVIRKALEAQSEEGIDFLCALAVCSPAGSPRELVFRMLPGDVETRSTLDQLLDRSLVAVTTRNIRLPEVVRLDVERRLAAMLETREQLEWGHAEATRELFEDARERRDAITEDDLYGDLCLAVDRLIARCKPGAHNVGSLLGSLADALLHYPRGGRVQNLQRVATASRLLLTVFDHQDSPMQWAAAQNLLAIVLPSLPAENSPENLQEAVVACHQALSLFTPQGHPYKWALVQNSLGNALMELATGDPRDNLRASTEAFRAALSVLSPEAHPQDWAGIQNNLALALTKLGTSESLQEAVKAYEAALLVLHLEDFPRDWARIRANLGRALLLLPMGDHVENLRKAIAAFQDALTIYTPDDFPEEHAHTQRALDAALQSLAAATATP